MALYQYAEFADDTKKTYNVTGKVKVLQKLAKKYDRGDAFTAGTCRAMIAWLDRQFGHKPPGYATISVVDYNRQLAIVKQERRLKSLHNSARQLAKCLANLNSVIVTQRAKLELVRSWPDTVAEIKCVQELSLTGDIASCEDLARRMSEEIANVELIIADYPKPKRK